jgi:TolB-like protein/Tfp pilus assembly protein PilF
MAPWLMFGALAVLAVLYISWQRLKAPTAAGDPSGGPTISAPASPLMEQSVAVLPFVSESADQQQEHFADGLTDEMINLLGKVPDLRVPSLRSSFYFKGKNEKPSAMAKELGVAHLLDGTVRRSGKRLRISAQLVRADNGFQLWSQTFDRETGDIFKIQDEIAAAVVAALKLKLVHIDASDRVRGTTNVEAYNQFMIAESWMHESTKTGVLHAIDAVHKALELDPTYADAQARLAIAEGFLSEMEGKPALLDQAIADADKAVAMGPDRWLPYVIRGSIYYLFRQDFTRAQPDLDRAIQLNPQNAFALAVRASMLGSLGNLREALQVQRRAAELDPLNHLVILKLGRTQAGTGDYAAAVATYRRALRINPAGQDAQPGLASALVRTGQAAEGRAVCDQMLERADRLACVADAEHALGHHAAAKQALEELVRIGGESRAYEIAMLYWGNGDATQAFTWLDKAFDRHLSGLAEVHYDRQWDGLRDDPRWAALLSKLKLPTKVTL